MPQNIFVTEVNFKGVEITPRFHTKLRDLEKRHKNPVHPILP